MKPWLLLEIVSRESGWRPAVPGDHGESFGLVQIHLPDHPDVTKAQATDPIFALTWAAKELALGHCSEWTTCPL